MSGTTAGQYQVNEMLSEDSQSCGLFKTFQNEQSSPGSGRLTLTRYKIRSKMAQMDVRRPVCIVTVGDERKGKKLEFVGTSYYAVDY
jgi:hypothetical protein